jgi:hypothetical protein
MPMTTATFYQSFNPRNHFNPFSMMADKRVPLGMTARRDWTIDETNLWSCTAEPIASPHDGACP